MCRDYALGKYLTYKRADIAVASRSIEQSAQFRYKMSKVERYEEIDAILDEMQQFLQLQEPRKTPTDTL